MAKVLVLLKQLRGLLKFSDTVITFPRLNFLFYIFYAQTIFIYGLIIKDSIMKYVVILLIGKGNLVNKLETQ